MRYSEEIPSLGAVLTLYNDAGWTGYLENPQVVKAALAGTTWIRTAYDGNELVAMIRAVSDDATIAFLQDIVVLTSHQRRGIGRELVAKFLERFSEVRHKALLTDDGIEQRAFYESLGFSNVGDLKTTPLNAYVRIEGIDLS